MDKTHLGDGLYVSFDGFGFTLSAPRHDGEHWVYFEPYTLDAFNEYIEAIKRRAEKSA